jgi:hypothetical protein
MTTQTLSIQTKNKKKEKICRICYLEEENDLENQLSFHTISLALTNLLI